MKLISLNTWEGKCFEELTQFLDEYKNEVDIFCFQEVDHFNNPIEIQGITGNLYSKLEEVLVDFNGFFVPSAIGYNLDGETLDKIDFDLEFGLAIFIRKGVNITTHDSYQIYIDETSNVLNSDFSNLPIKMQKISFEVKGRVFSVYNFHGIPKPGSKLDTTKRLDQSNKIKNILDRDSNARILVGDFNLLPDTESIKILENGYRNLIKEFNIKETRSKLSPYYGTPEYQKYADYAFVSNEVDVEGFETLDMAVSDHLPLFLIFKLYD